MKISVITVVLNDVEGLKKTAQSVISQKGDDYEYVVLDGESTDGSWEYIRSLDFEGVKKRAKDTGIYNAMNHAVQLAKGDYVIFLNAGDTFFDNEVLMKAAGIIGESDLYVGHTKEIEKRIVNGMAPNPLTLDFLMKTSIYHQSTFIRRKLLLEHPYNEQHMVVSDWEFFFERWLNGSTYEMLDFFVSNYYLGGFSYVHKDLIAIERREFIESILPKRIVDGSYLGVGNPGLGNNPQYNSMKVYEERNYLLKKRKKHNKIIRILIAVILFLLTTNVVLLIIVQTS